MSRYGSITPLKGFNQGKQTRIYVQLGRKDGFSAKEIAKYFSELLGIQQRMVDRIEVTENFSLVSLPTNAAKDILDRSKNDNSLPHMHLDSKESGGGGRGGRGRDSGFGGGRGRSNDGRSRRDGGRSFRDDDRSGRDGGRRGDSGRGGRDGNRSRDGGNRGGDRRRKGAVPGIERRSDEKTGNASLYRKNRGSRS